MECSKPKFFISKYDRHILLPKAYVENNSDEEIFDLLLDFGFRTKLELFRFTDDDQNLVEFVQDLNIEGNFEQDFETSGADLYH